MFSTGPKEWIVSGYASLLWMIPLIYSLANQGRWVFFTGFVFLLLSGMAYVVLVGPKRHPKVPFFLIYTGLMMIQALGAALAVFGFNGSFLRHIHPFYLVFPLVLLIPLVFVGRKKYTRLQ